MKSIFPLLLIAFLLFSLTLFAQEATPEVLVKYESPRRGCYKFYAINNSKYTVTIDLDFTELENLSSDKTIPFNGEAKPGKTDLFEISYIKDGIPVKFKYEFTYIAGSSTSPPDYSFIYLLPVKEGSKAQATDFSKLYPTLPEEIANPVYAIYLRSEKGDTIYSARSGYVFKVTDTASTSPSPSPSNSSNTIYLKSIEIYHFDGSFGYYQIMDKILVKSGDRIIAGQPLATVLTDGIPFSPHFIFAVYHNTGRLLDKDGVFHQSPANPVKSLLLNDLHYEKSFIPLSFLTKEEGIITLEPFNDYTATHPQLLILKELSHKEIKQINRPTKQK